MDFNGFFWSFCKIMKIVQILGMKRNDKLARNEVARKIYFEDDLKI